MTLAIGAVIHEWTDLAGKSSHGHDSTQRKSFGLCLLAQKHHERTMARDTLSNFGSNEYQTTSINTDRRLLFLRII